MTQDQRDKLYGEVIRKAREAKRDWTYSVVRLQMLGDNVAAVGKYLEELAAGTEDNKVLEFSQDFDKLKELLEEHHALRKAYAMWQERLAKLEAL